MVDRYFLIVSLLYYELITIINKSWLSSKAGLKYNYSDYRRLGLLNLRIQSYLNT